MEQLERKPILKIEMTVKTNTIKRQTDKSDSFGVAMKSKQGTLLIGMKEASATLSIKAADDEFVVLIYPRRLSEPEPQDRTQQTAFSTENLAKALGDVSPGAEVLSVHKAPREPEPLQQTEAFAEVPEEHEESPEQSIEMEQSSS